MVPFVMSISRVAKFANSITKMSANIPKISLSNGQEIPVVGLGTWRVSTANILAWRKGVACDPNFYTFRLQTMKLNLHWRRLSSVGIAISMQLQCISMSRSLVEH